MSSASAVSNIEFVVAAYVVTWVVIIAYALVLRAAGRATSDTRSEP